MHQPDTLIRTNYTGPNDMKLSVPYLWAVVIGLFVTGLPAVHAQNTWTGAAEITFHGTSPLSDFTGTVPCDPFTVTVRDLDKGLKQASVGGSVAVNSADMDTANETRDAKMHDLMKVKDHPHIIGAVEDLHLSETGLNEKGEPTSLPFTLTLLGKDLPMKGTLTNWRAGRAKVSFTLSFPVSLKRAGIEAPTLLKFFHVDDRIDVTVDIALTPDSGTVLPDSALP